MQCKSCTANIPSEWVHAINSNICPGCGGIIMEEQDISLLSELREAMKQMPNNPEGLAGWLLSNYRLSKIGDATPTKFHSKENKREVEDTEFLERKKKAASFMQRAGIKQSQEDIKKKLDEARMNNGVISEDDSDIEMQEELPNKNKRIITDPYQLEDAMGAGMGTDEPSIDDLDDLPFKNANNRELADFNTKVYNNRYKSKELADGGSIGLITRR